jgi:DNA ligase-1
MFGLSRKRSGRCKWFLGNITLALLTSHRAFADITISPTYTAAIGLVSEEKGLSLRFPRFLRKREDKGIEEASTNEFLAGLWSKQEERASTSTAKQVEGGGDDDDDDMMDR